MREAPKPAVTVRRDDHTGTGKTRSPAKSISACGTCGRRLVYGPLPSLRRELTAQARLFVADGPPRSPATAACSMRLEAVQLAAPAIMRSACRMNRRTNHAPCSSGCNCPESATRSTRRRSPSSGAWRRRSGWRSSRASPRSARRSPPAAVVGEGKLQGAGPPHRRQRPRPLRSSARIAVARRRRHRAERRRAGRARRRTSRWRHASGPASCSSTTSSLRRRRAISSAPPAPRCSTAPR